ncbi:MAG: bifunctional DNA-formamidopyrimidine glycosylase/DNA-(apurinic or apyrimidinic site) lyase [Rickettsiaceae bacterium]|nr:bifunctional DNA-formamidopyrimidine glycosylase/DNA-(apurinic or apyrimidinic site) lyase [Rickettsiaceae bacterium]
MPELAEVETLKRYLEQYIKDMVITDYFQYRDNLRYQIASHFKENLISARILDIKRRAKFLNLYLDNKHILTYHLGMSGRLIFVSPDYKRKKHDHIIIECGNKGKLVFNDTRRFGMIYLTPISEFDQQKFMINMGPEPLEAEFNAEYLFNTAQSRKIPIKNYIMDNKVLVGVGNIYAAESLFKAKIYPEVQAHLLSFQQMSNLVIAIKEVLNAAIDNGGTTLRDFVSGDNKPGYFQQKLKVYGREGQACFICDSIIQKLRQAGRSSFFCPICQQQNLE